LKKLAWLFAGCAFAVVLGASSAAGGNGRTTLAGSVPAWAKSVNAQGATSSSTDIGFRVYLSLRNQAQAETLARSVTDPASSLYGHYLTPAQWNKQFAPASADVSAVSSWLKSQGLTIVYTPSNNHYVSAEGTAAQVEAAFATKLKQYSVNRLSLRAPSTELSVPSSLASKVAGIVGVDESYALVKPGSSPEPAGPPPAGFRNSPPCSTYWDEKDTATTPVSDPARGVASTFLPDYNGSSRPFAPCGYAGSQLQSAYGVQGAIASGNDGKGVTVAIIDAYASPTIESDANTYFSNHGLPQFTAEQFSQMVAPGTYLRPQNPRQDPEGWSGEETLDVEAVHTMAPGANILYVGAPNNYQDLDAAMNHIVSGRLADIVSNSYGFSTEALPPGYINPFNDTLIQAAAEGIGVYFSSGDSGDETFGGPANTATADWPASSPWVTAVGGTSLAVGAGDSYLFETGWGTKRNRINCDGFLKATGTNVWCGTEPYLYGSGGGTSRIFAQPSYQQGVVPASLASRWGGSGRVVPDIAAVGDPNTGMRIGQTQTFSNGTYYDEYRVGGTSLSCPLTAGIMAVAQQAVGHPLGFANPLIYSLPAGAFHDVDHLDGAVARADYANSEDGSDGLLFSVRTFDVTFTLHTTPGYDDVTGRGSPNGSFIGAVVAAS
jgi:subtilase family serine protease